MWPLSRRRGLPRPFRLFRGAEAGELPSAVAMRVAALLRGGVQLERVFEVLAGDGSGSGAGEAGAGGVGAGGSEAGESTRAIAKRIRGGEGTADAISAEDGPEWAVISAAWRIAERSGAPLAPAMERIGASLQEIDRLRDRRAVLLAGPKATVRLVSVLPVLALVLGGVLGFDPLPVLLSGGGVALLVIGALLLLGGIWWARSLTDSVARSDSVAGLELELTWIALGGGAPPGTAVRRVTDCVDLAGARWVPFDAFCSGELLRTTVRVSERVGVPLGALLLEEAASARARQLTELERAAERLGVRVLAPLGACVLPSFVVLGVIPVVISMLGGNAF